MEKNIKFVSKTRKNNIANINNNDYDYNNYKTTYKFLQIKNNKNQTFEIKVEETKLTYNIQVLEKGKNRPCVIIHIPKNKNRGSLLSLTYKSSCSEEGLEKNIGVQYMLQTIFKYVIDTYKHITKMYISDTTSYDIDKNIALITPRYLLKGEPGYYERKLGAYPIDMTVEVLNEIKDNRKNIEDELPKSITNDWWTPDNIDGLCTKISADIIAPHIMNTSWEVDRDTIHAYDIPYTVKNIKKPYKGGSTEGSSYYSEYIMKIRKFMKV